MNRLKATREVPVLLAAVLLFQLSFHTLHAFSDHSENSFATHSTGDTSVGEAIASCGSCVHFLSNHLYFASLVLLFTGLVISSVSRISEAPISTPETPVHYLLRAPPVPRS